MLNDSNFALEESPSFILTQVGTPNLSSDLELDFAGLSLKCSKHERRLSKPDFSRYIFIYRVRSHFN